MNNWNMYINQMICIKCNNNLQSTLTLNSKCKTYDNSNITGELICKNCGAKYPLYQDIPIVFKDDEITQTLLDKNKCKELSLSASQKMKLASQVASDQLDKFKGTNEFQDALSWELLFWDKWQTNGKENIEKILLEDEEGGGRLRFFDNIKKNCNLKNKILLNIGAGKDRLLEKFINEGCFVIEQDIILESLLQLKLRGANFCICCDARDIPLKNNFVNISTSFEVLHHVYPINRPISELTRITKENIFFIEPNKFALTRFALLFPPFVKNKFKRIFSNDYAHSPYEYSINPLKFKKEIKLCHGNIIDFSYPKSTWIGKNSTGIKLLLRKLNLFILKILPICSAHYYANVKLD